MKTFPLIRVKWSNEHSMAAVLLVLVLYHLPQWLDKPSGILSFLLLVAEGLLLDLSLNILRYHRMWCCVSAAVTAAMISVLSFGVPLGVRMLGVAIALLVGKHLWGGTGKNIINPAMIGLLFILIVYGIPYPFFPASFLLIPAAVLSLLFLKIRPFAGIGIILGMMSALLINGDFTLLNLLSYGVFFWGGIVLTDPVTVTSHPVAGSAAGFLVGFAALLYYPLSVSIIIGILALNLFSSAVESINDKNIGMQKSKLRIPKQVPYLQDQSQMVDLTDDRLELSPEEEIDKLELSADEILSRIKNNEVFGMGGAAFSTYQKLMTVLTARESQKYLLINGVECDPGLIHDYWLLRKYPNEITKGIELLCKCINFSAVHLAVKDLDRLEFSNNINTHKVLDYYPIGAEKILIANVLKKQIEYNQIPAACGILVLNVQTIYAIYQAVARNKPVNTRFLTVANLKTKSAKVVRVRLGMKLREVMEAMYPGVINVFAGGGLMQSYLAEEEAVVDKNINFIATSVFPNYKESPQCSKCGNCVRNCPVGLKVNLIADLVDQGKLSETKKYFAFECISCGSCSYLCLAGRNLSDRVKTAKEATK